MRIGPRPVLELVWFFAWLLLLLLAAYLVLVFLFRWPRRTKKTWAMSVALCIGALLTFYGAFIDAFGRMDRANQREFRDKALLHDIDMAHRSMQWFHEEEGRYPQRVSEDAGVEQWVDNVTGHCERRDIKVTEVRLLGDEAGEKAERQELLTATDAEGKTLVVIYSDGTFGVSRRLLTRRASAGPREMEILR
jgi:hypothetical protein